MHYYIHTLIRKLLKAAKPVAKGSSCISWCCCGKVYFTAEDAKLMDMKKAKRVILVRLETSPEDIEGMHVCRGILTGRGGMTSHAAVVARGMGTCCVAGCGEIKINEEAKYFTIGGNRI